MEARNHQAERKRNNSEKQQQPQLLVDSVGVPLSPVINEQKKQPAPKKPSEKKPQV